MKPTKILKNAVFWLASPQAVATVQFVIAAVTLVQALDTLRNTDRKIGFKPTKG
jgi:hypothetical protein